MTVALGIVTYNRPEYLEKTAKAVAKNLGGVVDYLYIHNDGSDDKHNGAYKRAYRALPEAKLQLSSVNEGVARAKNALLGAMLEETDADWLFLLEDDVRPLSEKAVTGYVEACVQTNSHHLSFALHGPANVGGPVEAQVHVSYYPHSVGAFAVYSRECLEACGLFDVQMYNAFEHVEHELRLYRMGYAENCGPHRFPDATGSSGWLAEIPGSIDKSSIRPRADWSTNIRDSLRYWSREKPDTFAMLFGEGMPLSAYAKGIIG